MGMQDRDYYKEWLREKEGGFKQKPLNALVRQQRKMKQWHPLLTFLFIFALFAFVFGFLKFFVWIKTLIF